MIDLKSRELPKSKRTPRVSPPQRPESWEYLLPSCQRRLHRNARTESKTFTGSRQQGGGGFPPTVYTVKGVPEAMKQRRVRCMANVLRTDSKQTGNNATLFHDRGRGSIPLL